MSLDVENETDDSASSTESDEQGSTRKLRIGDKIKFYWPLNDQYTLGPYLNMPRELECIEYLTMIAKSKT